MHKLYCCRPGDDDEPGICIKFHANFNTFYDSSGFDYPTNCNVNYGYGATACLKIQDIFYWRDAQFYHDSRVYVIIQRNRCSGLVSSTATQTDTVIVSGIYTAYMDIDSEHSSRMVLTCGSSGWVLMVVSGGDGIKQSKVPCWKRQITDVYHRCRLVVLAIMCS